MTFGSHRTRVLTLILLQVALSQLAFGESKSTVDQSARAILKRECLNCHGEKKESHLDLRSREAILKGGKRGPAIVPGKADESLLFKAVSHLGELKMPRNKARLSAADLNTLHEWINAPDVWIDKSTGPVFTEQQKAFWSFQPIKDPSPPDVQAVDWVKSPIDRFILSRLEEQGLSPAPSADKRTLIRRVTYDLIGLPPTPEELDTFIADDSTKAFSALVDRSLASKQYGEKWARHWLDVVRYADTTSCEGSFIMRYAYRYRDYVVRAFNDDKPYDQFVIEQLAGDLLPPSRDIDLAAQRLIATGFLLLGEKGLVADDKKKLVMDIVDEQIDAIGRAFLGLTVSCARCHDHKFDPIPTRDYYAVAGILRSTNILAPGPPESNISMWTESRLLEIPGQEPIFIMTPEEGTPADLRVHIRGSADNLGEEAPRGFLRIIAGEDQASIATGQSGRLELARWIASPENPLTARVMVNRIWQAYFGTGLVATSDNFGATGDAPSHPELLDWLASRFIESGWSIKTIQRLVLSSSTYQMQSVSDNEKALKEDPDGRLLWRMNRRRLTAEDVRDSILAISGQLDRAVGGSIFDWQDNAAAVSPERGLYSASAIEPGTVFGAFKSLRRSLYLPVIRTKLTEIQQLFDLADPNTVTAKRGESTTALQGLFLTNNPFVRDCSLAFANRLLTEISQEPLLKSVYRLGLAEPNDENRLRLAHVLAVGRSPTQEELERASTFLGEYARRRQSAGLSAEDARLAAWQSYCQTLFMMNEFLYVD
jgi:cytochrome c553